MFVAAFEGDDEDETDEGQNHGYLVAAMNFEPGYFACDCVWRKQFVLHPRLKTGTQRQGMTRGLLSLRSILIKFSVGNRRNMFVIKETSSHNVFYLKWVLVLRRWLHLIRSTLVQGLSWLSGVKVGTIWPYCHAVSGWLGLCFTCCWFTKQSDLFVSTFMNKQENNSHRSEALVA